MLRNCSLEVPGLRMEEILTKCWCGGEIVTPRTCLESRFHDPCASGRPKKVTRLYVAGPMSGYPESNYPAFALATVQLQAAGFEVVDPGTFGDGAHYVDFLREDLKMMLECHGVATIENWWESTGARNEVQVAGILKMPVRSVEEWCRRGVQQD